MKLTRRNFLHALAMAATGALFPKAKEAQAIEPKWSTGEPSEHYVNDLDVADFDGQFFSLPTEPTAEEVDRVLADVYLQNGELTFVRYSEPEPESWLDDVQADLDKHLAAAFKQTLDVERKELERTIEWVEEKNSDCCEPMTFVQHSHCTKNRVDLGQEQGQGEQVEICAQFGELTVEDVERIRAKLRGFWPQEEPEISTLGKVWYISRDGDDNNSGLNPDAARKTVPWDRVTPSRPKDVIYVLPGDGSQEITFEYGVHDYEA